MNKIENLRDLLIQEGRDIYQANQQELKELPNIEKQASSPNLKKIIKDQLQKVEEQQKRIETVFNNMNASYEGGKCSITESILKHSQYMINRSIDKDVRDAAIINSLQNLSHQKIASLGAEASYAREMQNETAAKLFHESVQDEKAIDQELSTLALLEINKKAVVALPF